MDFSKIKPTKRSKGIVDPIELFHSLKTSDPAVNDLWLAQGDALREWHRGRSLADVAIILNTGAGKTLVGLLAAQSLVNETNSHVLYACSSIQLVKQTAAKAQGYGLEPTTYFSGAFSNDLYQAALAPCITTYQALFNGRSKFFREDISAIVLDDAHAADHLLRDQFTLRISRKLFPGQFSAIVGLFRDYYTRIGQGVGYIETIERKVARSWFVPPFAVRSQLNELQRLVVAADPGRSGLPTRFAWEYLKDRLDLCAVFVTRDEISFTPALLPTLTLPYFKKDVRRLYLSATLAARDAFLRTFGKIPDLIIAPSTTAGECERLIAIPSLNKDCHDEIAVAKGILNGRKALILVPDYRRAELWNDVAPLEENDDAAERVEDFKKSNSPTKLLLVGRYDGVDLPGDTCRVLVIDELPSGVGPLERFLWERLGLAKGLNSTVASRIIQSFGRISRGMSDHGVVVLTGERLIRWLLTPKNRFLLPPFLRRQLGLGVDLSKQAASAADIQSATRQALERDPAWLKYYEAYMEEDQIGAEATGDEEQVFLAGAETEFGHLLWARDYESAAKSLSSSIDQIFSISRNSGAWDALWLGYSYELMGDEDTAHSFYRRAHAAGQNIPPYELVAFVKSAEEFPSQILEVAKYLYSEKSGIRVPSRFDAELAPLDGTGSSSLTEESIRALGEYLGMKSTRPDNEYGTGPDVLWDVARGPALCLEVKTEKTSGSCYQKKEVGQLFDHVEWVKDHSKSERVLPAFVGPPVAACSQANPSRDIMVIELSEFRELAEVVRAALRDISLKALPLTLRQVAHDVFRERGLLLPDVYTRLKKLALRSIVGKPGKPGVD